MRLRVEMPEAYDVQPTTTQEFGEVLIWCLDSPYVLRFALATGMIYRYLHHKIYGLAVPLLFSSIHNPTSGALKAEF